MNLSLFRYLNQNRIENSTAIMFYPSRMTFASGELEIGKAKLKLESSGVKPGDPILMLTPLGDQFYINIISLLQYGAIPVLIDIALGWKTVKGALKGLGIKFVMAKNRPLRIPASTDNSVLPQGTDVVYFTSGSTGIPKPIYYQKKELVGQIEILRRSRFFESADSNKKTLSCKPIPSLKKPRRIDGRILCGYSCLPVFGFYQLLMGMAIWSKPLINGKCLQSDLEGENRGIITDLCLNPKIINEWIDQLTIRYLAISDYLERIVVVSNPLPLNLLQQVQLRMPLHGILEQTYGCTEAFPLCVSYRSGPHEHKFRGLSLLSVGPSFPEFEIELRPTSALYRAPSPFGEKVQQIWVKNLAGRMIHTGDLGYKDLQSNLIVLGREKYTYIYKDKTYYSMLWELKAREIPEVKDVVLLQESP